MVKRSTQVLKTVPGSGVRLEPILGGEQKNGYHMTRLYAIGMHQKLAFMSLVLHRPRRV